MNKFLIRPSILDVKEDNLKDYLKALEEYKQIDCIHFDVMDGKFVSKTSFSPLYLSKVSSLTSKEFDVHLMAYDLENNIKEYAKNGAKWITFHFEAFDKKEDILNTIKLIKSLNCKVGLSIKPSTSISEIEDYLNDLDLALVMSVEPGLGGQMFMDSAIEKIACLNDLRIKNNYKYVIEVDGGINDLTYKKCVENGCDVLVSGSYIFNGDIKENIRKMVDYE